MKKLVKVLTLAVMAALLLAPVSHAAAVIDVNGSTSVEPLMQALSDLYKVDNPDVTINITAPGSSAGIKAATDGTAQIGMSSRELKEEEKAAGLTETVIALDGIAVIVNQENPVADLTSEQIAAIYKGEITNWKDVGGEDSEILLVCREAGSGTRDAFEELMGLIDSDKKSLVYEDGAIFESSTNSVRENVAGKKNAIGYVSLGSMSEEVKAVKVDGVEASDEEIVAGNYKVSRPFLLLTKPDAGETVSAFLDYVMSDAGQAVVAEKGFISAK